MLGAGHDPTRRGDPSALVAAMGTRFAPDEVAEIDGTAVGAAEQALPPAQRLSLPA